MVHSRQKDKWIVYTLAMLLCLVLVSFWLMCNMYAKYTSQASGSDSARVAKFNVTATGTATEQIKVEVYPGFKNTYQVDVTNGSEVAIEYIMDIKNKYENLPLKFQMLDKDGKEIISKKAEISAQDHTAHTYTLKISWPTNTEDQTTDPQDPAYAGKADVIEITLNAVQKD